MEKTGTSVLVSRLEREEGSEVGLSATGRTEKAISDLYCDSPRSIFNWLINFLIISPLPSCSLHAFP
jgi:hypothetical protein